MSVRHNKTLRSLARRVPLVSAYEDRIADLTTQVAELQARAAHHVGAGLWVPPGHFYSPIPPVDELRAREAELYGKNPRIVPGVDLREAEQWALLDELLPLADGVDFAHTEADARIRGDRYWTDNPSYGDGDGLFLTLLLRYFRPKRMIELGSGFSSACSLDARDKFVDFEMTCVDPYPDQLEALLKSRDRDRLRLLPIGTQHLDLDMVRELEANDILFVDSTHVSRTGSDVNTIFSDILPALKPGVIVHIHDVFPNFEYPQPWVYEGRGWNELYVLRAFLQYNEAFEVVLWPGLLIALDIARITGMFPPVARHWGGAFWMRKVA